MNGHVRVNSTIAKLIGIPTHRHQDVEWDERLYIFPRSRHCYQNETKEEQRRACFGATSKWHSCLRVACWLWQQWVGSAAFLHPMRHLSGSSFAEPLLSSTAVLCCLSPQRHRAWSVCCLAPGRDSLRDRSIRTHNCVWQQQQTRVQTVRAKNDRIVALNNAPSDCCSQTTLSTTCYS